MNLKTNFNFAFLPMAINIISNWIWCVAIGRNAKAFEASAILAGVQLSQHNFHV
jgi:hypothetical protein